MSAPVVISLCDLTGNFVKPWVDAGCEAVLVDPQHETTSFRDGVLRAAMTIEDAFPMIAQIIKDQDVVFVSGFPPCTDLASSGARWWAAKREVDYMFQAKAAALAEQCRTIGALSGAPYLVENPSGALSRVFGPPSHTFDPYEYTGYERGDNYTKRTCLWTGNDFVMPLSFRDNSLGEPDDRIHKAPPGAERPNFRSATPMGFARAVFIANHPAAQEAAA